MRGRIGMRDSTTVDERIFDFAYELAMRDATMRRAFTGATIYVLLGKTQNVMQLPSRRPKRHTRKRRYGITS